MSAMTNQKAQLTALYNQIGIARFSGRVNSGVIDASLGYEVIQQKVAEANKPVGIIGYILHAINPRL